MSLPDHELQERLLELKGDLMPGRKYKKRHLKELSASERTAIVHRSLIGLEHRPDLAKEYRVSRDLI